MIKDEVQEEKLDGRIQEVINLEIKSKQKLKQELERINTKIVNIQKINLLLREVQRLNMMMFLKNQNQKS